MDSNWKCLNLDSSHWIFNHFNISWTPYDFLSLHVQMQNGHFSLTQGSSGNRLRVEFKLSLLKQFLFLYNLVTCQCQWKVNTLTQISSTINLSVFSSVSLTPYLWCDLDREVMFKCDSDLLTPSQPRVPGPDMQLSSPLTCDQSGIFLKPLHSIRPVMALIIH